jgi:hypothetical protein
VEISLEIITEKFRPATIIEMSQTQLPTRQAQQQQALQITNAMQSAIAQVQQNPQLMQQAQPQLEAAKAQLQKIKDAPTIEQVLTFLKDNKAKSFVLDIETDSTIMPDENAEKQRRTEFTQVLGGLLQQLSTMIQNEPKTAEFAGEVLKFATAPFRAGRSLDGAIDSLIEQFKAKGDQPQGDDPATAAGKIQLQIEQMKQQTAAAKIKQDGDIAVAKLKQDNEHKQLELQNERAIKQAELQAKQGDADGKMEVQNQKMMESREAHQAHMLENQQKMALDRQKGELAARAHQMKGNDMAQRANERQMAARAKVMNPNGGGPV